MIPTPVPIAQQAPSRAGDDKCRQPEPVHRPNPLRGDLRPSDPHLGVQVQPTPESRQIAPRRARTGMLCAATFPGSDQTAPAAPGEPRTAHPGAVTRCLPSRWPPGGHHRPPASRSRSPRHRFAREASSEAETDSANATRPSRHPPRRVEPRLAHAGHSVALRVMRSPPIVPAGLSVQRFELPSPRALPRRSVVRPPADIRHRGTGRRASTRASSPASRSAGSSLGSR